MTYHPFVPSPLDRTADGKIKRGLSIPRCICCKIRAGSEGRGLCRHCHNDLSIRNRYKPIVNTRPNLGKPEEVYLPTKQEIEELKMAIRYVNSL